MKGQKDMEPVTNTDEGQPTTNNKRKAMSHQDINENPTKKSRRYKKT